MCYIYFYVNKYYNRLTYVYICMPFFQRSVVEHWPAHLTQLHIVPRPALPRREKSSAPGLGPGHCVASLSPWWFPPKQNSMEMISGLSLWEVTQLQCKFATASPEPQNSSDQSGLRRVPWPSHQEGPGDCTPVFHEHNRDRPFGEPSQSAEKSFRTKSLLQPLEVEATLKCRIFLK